MVSGWFVIETSFNKNSSHLEKFQFLCIENHLTDLEMIRVLIGNNQRRIQNPAKHL